MKSAPARLLLKKVFFKRYHSRNVPFYVKLRDARKGVLSREAVRSLTITIDYSNCILPRRAGGGCAPGLPSGLPNKLFRKHSVCSSTPWVKIEVPEPYWIYDDMGGHSLANLFYRPRSLNKEILLNYFFNLRQNICAHPKWFKVLHDHCSPLAESRYAQLDAMTWIQAITDMAKGKYGQFGRVAHQGICRESEVKPEIRSEIDDALNPSNPIRAIFDVGEAAYT